MAFQHPFPELIRTASPGKLPEYLASDHPLLALPNLIATPHVAFYSEESVLELEVQAAQNVAAILSGRRPATVVNPEVLDLPRWSHLI